MLYYVSRNGWNTANQPSACSPLNVRVAEVEAASANEACKLAAQKVTVYNNQYLFAEQADAAESTIDDAVTVLAE